MHTHLELTLVFFKRIQNKQIFCSSFYRYENESWKALYEAIIAGNSTSDYILSKEQTTKTDCISLWTLMNHAAMNC